MDDIEDIGSGRFSASQQPPVSTSSDDYEVEDAVQVLPHALARPSTNREVVGDIPGTQTVYIKTQGCAHNVSDSEYMAGLLASYGYRITEQESDKPDVYLFNSCTVKGPSQDSFLHAVKRAKGTGRPVVVAGCVPQGQPTHGDFEGLSVIGVQQINRVVEVVEETLRGNAVRLLGQRSKPSLDLPKIRRNDYIEVIPISTGCLNNCTYCKTKHARGKLGSYTLDAIVSRAKAVVVEENVLEVRLTSEDTGAYGRDIDTDIAILVNKVAEELAAASRAEGAFAMLKVGMTNPPYMLEHIERIADLLRHPNVYSFLHIPVQSGSDSVLEAMKREYTNADFCRVADILIERVPGVCLATDIICGFPNETEEDFEETMKLVAKYRFPFINISQFYPRPGTPAARMKRLPTEVVKARSRRLTALINSFDDCFSHLVGTTQKVWLVNEKASDGIHALGHTKCYVQVMLDASKVPTAGCVTAEITSAQRWCVIGRVVEVISVASTPHPALRVDEAGRALTASGDYVPLTEASRKANSGKESKACGDGDCCGGGGAGGGAGSCGCGDGGCGDASVSTWTSTTPNSGTQALPISCQPSIPAAAISVLLLLHFSASDQTLAVWCILCAVGLIFIRGGSL